MDDLNIIEPQTYAVLFAGERLEIQPLTIGQVPAMVRQCRRLVDAALDRSKDLGDDDSAIVSLVVDMIADHGEEVIAAVAIACKRDHEFIASVGVDDFTELAVTVFEVNRDFFAQRMAPQVSRLRDRLRGAGVTPSKPSSSTATP